MIDCATEEKLYNSLSKAQLFLGSPSAPFPKMLNQNLNIKCLNIKTSFLNILSFLNLGFLNFNNGLLYKFYTLEENEKISQSQKESNIPIIVFNMPQHFLRLYRCKFIRRTFTDINILRFSRESRNIIGSHETIRKSLRNHL